MYMLDKEINVFEEKFLSSYSPIEVKVVELILVGSSISMKVYFVKTRYGSPSVHIRVVIPPDSPST